MVKEPFATALRDDLSAERFSERLKELALFIGELVRHRDLEDDDLIAPTVAAQMGDPAITETLDLARLGARRDPYLFLAIDGGHGNLVPKDGLSDIDHHLENEVVPLALKEGVLLNVDKDIKITGRATTGAGIALAGKTNARPIVDSGRDFDL
jgi:hypothetical protein